MIDVSTEPSNTIRQTLPTMKIFTSIAFVVLLIGRTTSVQAQGTACPPDYPTNRSLIEMILTAEHEADIRANHEIPESAINALHVLGGYVLGRDDQTICASLGETFAFSFPFSSDPDPDRRVVFYRAGSFYFAVLTIRQSPKPRRLRVGTNTIVVYDSNLNQIGGYAY